MARTIAGVQIAKVGTYMLSTGEHTFTRQQLAAAVRNASILAPRIGIGHLDPRFAEEDQDGEPAIGIVKNLRLDDGGDTLIGDFAEMPEWLAAATPSAYPGRSLEGSCDGDDLVISAVKLLGTTKPGIHTLADLELFVSDRGPALMAAGADNVGKRFTVLLAGAGFDPASRSDVPNQAASRPDPQEDRMTPEQIAALRTRFGLADDATPEAVQAEYDKWLAEPPTTEPTAEEKAQAEAAAKAEADEAAAKAAADAQTEAEAAEAAAKEEKPETVAIAASVWTDHTTRLAAAEKKLRDRDEADAKTRRDLKASAAVTAGKLMPADKDHIRKWLDENEDSATAYLDSLTAGRVPVAAKARNEEQQTTEEELLAISRARDPRYKTQEA